MKSSALTLAFVAYLLSAGGLVGEPNAPVVPPQPSLIPPSYQGHPPFPVRQGTATTGDPFIDASFSQRGHTW